MLMGLDEYSLYFNRGDPGNGLMLTPHAAYEQRFSPYDSWSAGVREQVFMSLGSSDGTWAGNTTGVATSALGGYKHRFSEVTTLTLTAGPARAVGQRCPGSRSGLRRPCVRVSRTAAMRTPHGLRTDPARDARPFFLEHAVVRDVVNVAADRMNPQRA